MSNSSIKYVVLSIISILLFSYLIESIGACESLKTIQIEEEVPYPSVSYLDVVGTLKQSGYLDKNYKDRNSVYLVETESSSPFIVNEGNLLVKGRLDREQLCKPSNNEDLVINRCCSGRCCVYLQMGWPKMDLRTVYIRVDILDKNDNTPIFPSGYSGNGNEVGRHLLNPIFKVRLHENVEIGWSKELPKAIDNDVTENGIQEYRLKGDSRCPDCFQIKNDKPDSSPFLVTRVKLDRETLAGEPLLLHLLAIDGATTSGVQHTGTLSIQILIEDVNDNAPQFETSALTLTLSEQSRPSMDLRTITVTDVDEGINGQIDYEILDYTKKAQQHFIVTPNGQNRLVLRLSRSVDYEEQRFYKFAIVAKDRGSPSMSSSVSVTIRVTNYNDEPPVIKLYDVEDDKSFRPLEYSTLAQLTRPENGPKHSPILKLRVSDKDSPLSDLSCEVTRPNTAFYLKEIDTTSLIEKFKQYELLNSIEFDRETKYIYQILLTCSDSNLKDRLMTTAEIQLRISDVNDNSPAFNSAIYFGEIKETDKIGNLVHIKDNAIRVTDADEGRNSRLHFSLQLDEFAGQNFSNNPLKFIIEDSRLVITNTSPLDYENRQEYRLLIMVRDSGIPVRTSTAKLTIRVIDENDNQPQITKSFYSLSVLEEQPIGTKVGQITAVDADFAPHNTDLIYEINRLDSDRSKNDPTKLFRIENQSGRILTNAVLDRERIEHLSFIVRVRNTNPLKMSNNINNMGYSSSVPVSVTINDINDNSPLLKLKETSADSSYPYSKNVNKRIPIVIKLSKDSFAQHDVLSGSCSMFPYTYVDNDRDVNAQVRVSLKENPYFKLEMDGSLICPKNTSTLKAGFYTINFVGEDRNGDTKNHSRRTEEKLRVQVIWMNTINRGNGKANGYNKRNNKNSRDFGIGGNGKNFRGEAGGARTDDNFIDHKTVIIFIILIATIFVFCILLGLVVAKSRICFGRTRNQDIRKSEESQMRQNINNNNNNNNPNNNKNYRNLMVEYGTENKRLWHNYETGSLSQMNTASHREIQPASGFSSSTVMLFPNQHKSSVSSSVAGPNQNSSMIIAASRRLNQSSGNLSSSSPPQMPHQQHQYEHMQPQTMTWGDSSTLPINNNNDNNNAHLYNYLADSQMMMKNENEMLLNEQFPEMNDKSKSITMNTSTPHSTYNNGQITTSTSSVICQPNQKSINDVYLQTSFV